MTANNKVLFRKFLILLLILLAYFGYLGTKFGASSGVIVSFATWSFFVLCTPIADAGVLLDFPLRFFLGFRMVMSEIAVWILAILGNAAALFFCPGEYEKTFLTVLFHKILVTPNPYWTIIFLSMVGTFLSIKIGDDFYDVIARQDGTSTAKKVTGFKARLLVFTAIFAAVVIIYTHLLAALGINI